MAYPAEVFKMECTLAELTRTLEGCSRTEKPVVAKADMLKSIRQHNINLREISEGCNSLVADLDVLAAQQAQVMGTVGKLESCFEQHENLFAEVNNSLLSTEEQLARLWKQTHKLTSLEQQQRQHEAEFQDVQRWRAQLTATRVLEASALEQRLGAFRGELDEQDRSILTLQDRLCHLSKELYIGSDQVSVSKQVVMSVPKLANAPNTGEEQLTTSEGNDEHEVEMSLTSALSLICTTYHDIRRSLELQRRTAALQADKIELKASKDTEVLAANNRQQLDEIQQFLDSNMDVDLMDIRRNQDLILSQLEDHQNELDEKTCEAEVRRLIQSNHDDLVSHIQLALRSVKNDEANFKACIDRIESFASDLKNTKAERAELEELRVQLGAQISEVVKATRQLGPNGLTQLNNAVQRDDLLLMLQGKADALALEILSKQASSSESSIKQMSTQITIMLEKYNNKLMKISMEREHGDNTLGSRLDRVESMMATVGVPSKLEFASSETRSPTAAAERDTHAARETAMTKDESATTIEADFACIDDEPIPVAVSEEKVEHVLPDPAGPHPLHPGTSITSARRNSGATADHRPPLISFLQSHNSHPGR